MPLTDHLTDAQLNEYLDNETVERALLEAHLSSCEECVGRLTALKMFFTEIESLPEVELTSPIVLHIPSASQLPRWLTLTATLQVAFALLTVILAAPFISSLVPAIETPSLTDVFLQLRSQWRIWLDILSTFRLPTLPQIPALEIPSLMVMLVLAVVSIVWLVGNGLLLRRQFK